MVPTLAQSKGSPDPLHPGLWPTPPCGAQHPVLLGSLPGHGFPCWRIWGPPTSPWRVHSPPADSQPSPLESLRPSLLAGVGGADSLPSMEPSACCQCVPRPLSRGCWWVLPGALAEGARALKPRPCPRAVVQPGGVWPPQPQPGKALTARFRWVSGLHGCQSSLAGNDPCLDQAMGGTHSAFPEIRRTVALREGWGRPGHKGQKMGLSLGGWKGLSLGRPCGVGVGHGPFSALSLRNRLSEVEP